MPATGFFCMIEGIEGDSKIDGFENQIELLHFELNIKQPLSNSTGTGSLTAPAEQYQEFRMSKSIDKASPKLMLYAIEGKHIKKVDVSLCRTAQDKPVAYLKYEFGDVVLSFYHQVADLNGDNLPDEKFGFTYQQIKITYTGSGLISGRSQAPFSVQHNLRTGRSE